MTLRALWLACTALTVVAGPTVSQAQVWNGSSSTNWFDATNWSTNAVPTALDNVFVDTIVPNPTVISGAAAVSNVGRIATAVGSTGQVTVTGAGSSWANSGFLGVGIFGSGTLVIQNGGQVTNTFGVVGTNPGSTGQVTVSGAASTWTNSSFLDVGNFGTGTLVIQNGGRLTNTFGSIGHRAGSTGQATVDGAGSSWTNSGSLAVGDLGAGTLVIQNGGQVTNTVGEIGAGAGSTGQATVDGAGSIWTNSSSLRVGNLGAGTLVIQNGGRVTNTFGVIGNSTLASGSVMVDGAGASWTNTQMRIGNSGTGSVTIRNGGTVNATDVLIAVTSTAVGTLNIGAASGAAAVAPGTLSAPTVKFGVGAGQVVFNHTATSYVFAPLISGAGTVRVENGTTNLTANSTYTGDTLVNGGTLLVNGSIASSPTTVNAGGTLGGAGTVGNTTISGGTLSPGNSVGTLTVQGSLVFTAASSYLVEIDASGADRTNVTGTATPGGAPVAVNVSGGSNRRHTILNATGGVAGTFGAATANNFIATLSYDANNVFLDLQAALGLGTPLNQNQQAVATTLNNAFSNGNILPSGFFTLFNLTGDKLANALSQVSGETATGTQQATFDAMGQFTSMLLDPSLGERGGASAYADGANSYASLGTVKVPPLAAAFAQRWNVWAAGYGGTQSTDGNATVGSNDVTSKIFGAAAGFDYRLSPQTLVGFSLGGAGTKYDLANGLGSGRSEMFQAGVYGRHDIGATYLAGALAYGWQDVTTDRNVLLSSLRANFDTNAISGRLEAGYRFATGPVGLTPYAAGQFTTVFLPGYAEQVVAGVNTFALFYAGKDVTASRSELGLRADRSFAARDAIVTLRGRAAWAHNFNTDRSITTSFQTLPVSSFVVNGAAPARDAALVSASAETRWLNGVSVAASFDGEFSNLTESYAGKGAVRYRW